MNFRQVLTFVTIFGLLCFSTHGVQGKEEEDESTRQSDEPVTPSSNLFEGKEDEDPNRIPSSPDLRTIHVFTQPAKANELVAGQLTRLLVGTRNKGVESFVIESIDGSLRYPQDFTYYIQNFTLLRPEQLLDSGFESTFEYLFMPSETFNGRPMGLVVLLNYRNQEGKRFQNVVFNQTINFVETDEGFDGETFFLYIFLGAIAVLGSFLAYQYLLSARVKRVVNKSTSNGLAAQQGKGNYDLDWIPKHHLTQSRSPKSTRERKSRTNNEQTNGGTSGAASSENDD